MDSAGQETPDERLKREIEELRQRLEETARKGRQLSSDTELLIKKTRDLNEASKISCADPNWRQLVQSREIGPEGIWITDVKTADDIQFVAEFAVEHQLAMTYGKKSFHLSPESD